MKSSVLIVDDEAGVRSALSGVLRDEGYDVEAVPSGEACLTIVGRQAGRCHPARRVAAGHRRVDDAVAAARAPRRRGSRDHLRARQRRVRRARDQDGRVRFRRKAALARQDDPRRAQRAAPASARNGEPRAARARRSPPRDGRREPRDPSAARADRDGRADQRPRADLRRERHRQGTRRAQHPRPEPAAQRARSSK